jgi:RsiW-degrading membrane proteinase PrsW (M82 family)
MTNWTIARNSTLLVGILLASAVGMLWMFWHHPVSTSILTILVLSALVISAALARLSDGESSGAPLDTQSESINFQ